MKKILLFLIFSIFLISLVSANLGTFKQGECIDIKTILNTTQVNISTISYPNLTTAISSQETTKTGQTFNYTFCQTSILGNYVYDYYDSEGNVYVNDFIITPTGLSQSTSQGIGSMVYIGLMIILMFVFGFLGFKFSKTQNLWIFGIFFIFLSSLFLIYNVWLGYEYHRNFTGLTDSSTPETIFYIFLLILVVGLLISLTLLFLNWKKVFKYVKQEIKRNDDKDDKNVEDWDFDGGSFSNK